MQRRTLLQNLISSVVALPMLASADAKIIEYTSSFGYQDSRTTGVLTKPDEESYMRRATRLAGNNPKYPFAALLVDQKGVVVAEGWNRSVHNPTWHGEMDAINKCAASLSLIHISEPTRLLSISYA